MNSPASRGTRAAARRQHLDATADQGWLAHPERLHPGAVVSGPLYAEVKRRVLQALMNGEWPQGAPIPTESALAQRYGVSVGTVRKALGELVAERVLVRQPGRGTFAARHDRDSMLEAFFHIVDERGVKEFPASELLSFERSAADENAARRLDLEAGAPVIAFANLLRLQGAPVIYDRIAVSGELCRALDEKLLRQRDMTIFALYQARCGVTVTRLEEWIRAEAAPAAVAKHLRLKTGAPVLAIERVAQTYDGTPVEYRERYVSTAHHAYLNVLGMNRQHRR
jgi:GntR family transcriptional regulator